MNSDDNERVITLDGKNYEISKLEVSAKKIIDSIDFVDGRIQELNNELAIADTARIGYINALKSELK